MPKIIEVSTSRTCLSFIFQDNPEARITIHQASTHPVPTLPLSFYDLAAFRLTQALATGEARVTSREVEEAIERFNATAPAEGQVIDYRPGPDRWSR